MAHLAKEGVDGLAFGGSCIYLWKGVQWLCFFLVLPITDMDRSSVKQVSGHNCKDQNHLSGGPDWNEDSQSNSLLSGLLRV